MSKYLVREVELREREHGVTEKYGEFGWDGTKSVTVWRRMEPFGGKGWQVEINWSACGSQSVDVTVEFVACMNEALSYANKLQGEINLLESLKRMERLAAPGTGASD